MDRVWIGAQGSCHVGRHSIPSIDWPLLGWLLSDYYNLALTVGLTTATHQNTPLLVSFLLFLRLRVSLEGDGAFLRWLGKPMLLGATLKA